MLQGDDGKNARPAATGARDVGARPRLRRTVALIGLMGAGKSAVGRRLAAALGARFRDSDEEIERAAAMTIPEIFERYGERHFREGEQRVIARLLNDPPQVLATGGGAFMAEPTRALLKRRAHTVWLRADLDTLVARCGRKNNRPLLRRRDPRETLAELMDARYPIYQEAESVVDSVDGPHEAVVQAIIARLEETGDLM